jgi:hypothetical protein
MKRKFGFCIVLLACVILPVWQVMAADGTTDITCDVPLVTSEVNAINIDTDHATIVWKTNGNATSQVFYDTVYHADIGDYAYNTDEDTTLVLEHSVDLTGLSSATTYHYRVKSVIPDTEFIAISEDDDFVVFKPCFIATAAYGTIDAEQIDILRDFRDEVLLQNKAGAAFVSFYYKVSPPIAKLISQNEVLRTIVRVGFVDPLVAIVRFVQGLWDGPINYPVVGLIITDAIAAVGLSVFFLTRRKAAGEELLSKLGR